MSETAVLHFRIADDADRPRLISLINAAFAVETFLEGTRTDEQRLSTMMEKGKLLLAEDASGRIVASVYFEIRRNRGYLGVLAVDPAHQRTGIGKRMLSAAEDLFRAQGCEAIDISVLNLRPELPPLYRRLGFVEAGTEEFLTSRALKEGLECHCIVMSKQF